MVDIFRWIFSKEKFCFWFNFFLRIWWTLSVSLRNGLEPVKLRGWQAVAWTKDDPLHQGPLLLTGLTLIPAWISNYSHYKVWGEVTYPFPNLNGATIEVCERISNFFPHLIGHVITYPCPRPQSVDVNYLCQGSILDWDGKSWFLPRFCNLKQS